jgi:DNA-binding GntR family transcriptional regulator
MKGKRIPTNKDEPVHAARIADRARVSAPGSTAAVPGTSVVESRYLRVASTLRRWISDDLHPWSVIPTEEQLAKRFAVSRATIRRALGMLEQAGVVTRQRGRGTTVSPPKITRHFSPLNSFEEDMRRQGVDFETRIRSYLPKTEAPLFIRERLKLGLGATVGSLSLVRVVNDLIVCHHSVFFPPAVAASLDPDLVRSHSIPFALVEATGMPTTQVDFESEIVPAEGEVAAALRITAGSLIVSNTYTNYQENGVPVEAGTISYRIDRCKFHITGRLSGDLNVQRSGRRRGRDR